MIVYKAFEHIPSYVVAGVVCNVSSEQWIHHTDRQTDTHTHTHTHARTHAHRVASC